MNKHSVEMMTGSGVPGWKEKTRMTHRKEGNEGRVCKEASSHKHMVPICDALNIQRSKEKDE